MYFIFSLGIQPRAHGRGLLLILEKNIVFMSHKIFFYIDIYTFLDYIGHEK